MVSVRIAVRIFVVGVSFAVLAAAQNPPPTEKRRVTDEYHGVKVTDDFRWLENWDSTNVKSWSDAQNAYARSILDALPGGQAIRERVTDLHSGEKSFANVANGDGGEFAQFVRSPGGQWTQLTNFNDKIVYAVFGGDSSLYLLSLAGAPRGKILRLVLRADAGPRISDATVVVPESRDAVIDYHGFGGADTLVATRSRLYVVDLVGGPNRVRVFSPTGTPLGTLALPPVCAVRELLRYGRDGVLFKTSTFIEPSEWYEVSAGTSSGHAPNPAKRALSSTARAEFGDSEVVRDTAVSKDGTRVPLNVIRRRGPVLDGRNPALLIGYGGYSVSMSPFFLDVDRVWIEQGGVLAVANIRGGGEFGEDWHLAGNLTKKQNVFDDFIACAEYLIKARYTSPDRQESRPQ